MAEDKKIKEDTWYWIVLIALIGLAAFFITADFSRDWKIKKALQSESSSSSIRSSEREMRQQMQQMQGGGGMPSGPVQ